MSIEEFEGLVGQPAPAGLSGPLRALLCDAAGKWEEAHALVQDDPGRDAAWVHAYLHRKDGDIGNAGYWYNRAGRSAARGDSRAEWRTLAQALLGGAP